MLHLQEKNGTIFIDTNRSFHGIQLLFNKQNINFQFNYLEDDNQYHLYLKYEGIRFKASLESKNISPSLYHEIIILITFHGK